MRFNHPIFTGKERDEETGYGYFGARYMGHELMTMWLSVDPLADKYPSISPYAYCAWNPLKLVDPDGREVDDPEKKKKLESVNDKNKKNISEISWGETSGLYPTKNGEKIPNYENPVNWDEQKTEELMKARAAIHLIGTRRNTQVFRAKCTLKGIEKILAKYHLTSNFPPVDAEILNDKDVKYFYLSSFPTEATPSINSDYYDQVCVKTYGPFYNAGGGDAKRGCVYIHFYKAVPKKESENKKKKEG